MPANTPLSPLRPPFPLINYPWQPAQHSHTSQPPQQVHYPPSMPAIPPADAPPRHELDRSPAFQEYRHSYSPLTFPSSVAASFRSVPQEIGMKLSPGNVLVEETSHHLLQPPQHGFSGNNPPEGLSALSPGHTTSLPVQQRPPDEGRRMMSDPGSQPPISRPRGHNHLPNSVLHSMPRDNEIFYGHTPAELEYGIPMPITGKRKVHRAAQVSPSPGCRVEVAHGSSDHRSDSHSSSGL